MGELLAADFSVCLHPIPSFTPSRSQEMATKDCITWAPLLLASREVWPIFSTAGH